jgi:GDPmannose 4,6-dehydratase
MSAGAGRTAERRALVTGIGGQDGRYLAELLVSRGYDVVGCGRPGTLGGSRGDELRRRGIRILEVDLLDREQTLAAISEARSDEIYNLAGESFMPATWTDSAAAVRSITWPVIHLMDAMRELSPRARLFQSSSSEIFGNTTTSPQDETTPVAPANPYAAAKVLAQQLVSLYRAHYGLFACAGILYNHESPRRPAHFVTAKVCHAAKAIRAGKQQELWLGDLEVSRDWGFAGDSVDAMWRMLQQEKPEDYIIGTGVPHTVRELCELAFRRVGLDYREHVRQDPALMRPGQPTRLLADPSKARRELSWRATTGFEDLVAMMVDAAPA